MRTIRTTLAAVMLLLVGAGAANATLVWLDPNMQIANPGDVIGFDLWVDTQFDRGLYGWQLSLTFDPMVLNFMNATEGSFFVDGGAPATAFHPGTPGTGEVTAMVGTILGPNPGIQGTGILAQIWFRVIGSPGDFSLIELINGLIRDDLNQPISLTLNGARVDIPAIPEPTTLTLLLGGAALALLRRKRR